MFVGRIDEIETIEQCLFQAKNGNPQHFLIHGERGIGKSSLLFYVERVMSSQHQFLKVSIDLGGCETKLDIIQKVGRSLRGAIAERESNKEAVKSVLKWLTDWEVLGVRYHKPDRNFDSDLATEELINSLVKLCAGASGDLNGVILLIDEADRPNSEAGLGSFVKMVSERLSRKECNNVLFGLAGLSTILGKLRDSHESSPRLFETMLLEPLETDERITVVELGIKEANQINEMKTAISREALDFLAELSEGYPHFVQQFSYSAFEADSDNEIDVLDVDVGAFGEGGALSQLGDKYFSDMYHARIMSEEYRRVLDAMAKHGDKWVEKRTIVKESGVKETNVTNALQALKTKEIIISDDRRRGFYRLPTNSFAAWINATSTRRAQRK